MKYQQTILKPVGSVKRKNHIPKWANTFSRVSGLVIALCAMIMLSGCVKGDAEMLETCQERYSLETCLATLN